ncbi:MAG: type II secretion system protein [bacterium]|nr:type II secretion system protein [bacterium]
MFKNKKGFTLIELLLFMGLFSVVMLVLTSLFASIVQRQLEVEGTSASESDAAYILSRLQYDLSRTDSVIYPADPGQADDQIDLIIDGETYTYGLNESNLELTTPTDTYVLNGIRTTVSNVLFEHIGNTSGKPTIRITIDITSLATDASGPQTATINTTISLR